MSQHHQRRTESRPQGICTTNFMKIGPAVPEISLWQTDTQTDTQTKTTKLIAILGCPTGVD